MRPRQWPDHLDALWAKSPVAGAAEGERLAQHTWLVLERLRDLQHLRPELPQLVGVPQLWHCLFWTCLLHDLGKAATGFQAMLRPAGPRYSERHEVLSLVFLEWVAGGLSDEEQRWIVAAIVSHHRDAAIIEERYSPLADPDPLIELIADVEVSTLSGIWHWLDRCTDDWMTTLGMHEAGATVLPLMSHDQAVVLVQRQGVRSLRRRLARYQSYVDSLKQHATQQTVLPILLRGLTTSADHMASAHLGQLTEPVQEDWQHLASRILDSGQEPYCHQRASACQAGNSAILIAPTGSGKTEAALYWALGDGTQSVPRLFYALPYQASMNAMFDRLEDEQKGFGSEAVGLQHGRAVQAMYARLLQEETGPRTAARQAAWKKNVNSLNARPIKVFSPYQMLKAAFQLRGFEAILTDYAHAAFIFDEIHAYEPKRLALILALIKYLRANYKARFFVMSATFPQLIRTKLQDVLGPFQPIRADDDVFRKFRRHRLQLLDGELLPDGIPLIVEDVRAGKSVLACANTVRRAQEVYRALLAAGLSCEQVVLLHSRYIIKDRSDREQEIRERCEVGIDVQPFVLVATQVVEVSLNIDLDTIYTDPAPLEALLQRFGRINRARKKSICPVHVFRQPDDGQYVYGRHQKLFKNSFPGVVWPSSWSSIE